MKTFKAMASLGAATVALTGCITHSPETFAVANQDHREIKAREITHYLEVGAVQGFLSSSERRELRDFVSDFHTRGYGELIVSAPEGIPGAAKTMIEVEEIIRNGGVETLDLVLGGYPAGTTPNSPIVIAYKGYEAHVPGCSTVNEHDWANKRSNTTLPSFGCAVNENIAMMLADPADALGQRRLDPADAQRQGILLEKYRSGQSTTSSQTADGSSGG